MPSSFESLEHISANLNREDRAYIEKIDARLLGLLQGKHVREVKDRATLEQIFNLVKARGDYLRSTDGERIPRRMVEQKLETISSEVKRWKQIYVEDRVVRVLSDRVTVGVVDKDGHEYPFPKAEDIESWITAHAGDVAQLIREGIAELTIVPLASVSAMKHAYNHEISKVLSLESLCDAKGTPIPGLRPGSSCAIQVDESWENPPDDEYVRYFPAQIVEKGTVEGKSRAEVLAHQQNIHSPFAGYLVSFMEQNEVLPRVRQGKTFGNRVQLEAGLPAWKYLEDLGRNNRDDGRGVQFRGLTIEEWLAKAIRVMREGQRVLDHSADGISSECFLLGNVSRNLREVPRAMWASRNPYIAISQPTDHHYSFGTRLAVGMDGADGGTSDI